MSLALWEFNWDWGGAVGSSSSTSVVALSPLANSSANRDNNTYEMLPDSYWDARASGLKTDKKAAPPENPATDSANRTIPESGAAPERKALLDSFRGASSLDEMRAISAKLRGNT